MNLLILYILFHAGGKLYWVDHGSELIERADMDGRNREVVHTLDSEADPFSITVWGDLIYWTDWSV